MSTPMALIASGSFTSAGTARTITFPSQIDYFLVRNRSIWGSNPADLVVESTWSRGYGNGQATTVSEANTGVMSATLVATGGAGFTEVNDATAAPSALVATGTAITQANPAVVSDATSPAVGDIVRLSSTTGMFQISGIEISVTAVTAGVDYTLGFFDTSGFAAAATNVDYRIIREAGYLPTGRWITGITQAASAVITLSVTHQYSVGDIITVNVPDANFGMTEINRLTAEVLAVNTTTNTITVDIDSTGFTAFAYPTSAIAAAGISFPHTIPVGETATQLTAATDNVNIFGLTLGTAVVGANTDVMDWIAYSRDVNI